VVLCLFFPLQEAAQKPKKQKQPKQQAEPQAETKQPEQSSGEFDISAVELRVGKIVNVWNHPDSDKYVHCAAI
jgi:hypothetical protein